MDTETIRKIAEAARASGGAVTTASIRETAIDNTLAAELAAEQATTLSRLGRALDAAVSSLAEMAQLHASTGEHDAPKERSLREELRRLRWEMQVVREAMGLRGVRAEIERCWPVPPLIGAKKV